tara:strand:- start:1652 stop:2212 length:561 start_codon:yes stop_codon:yes gene_type:complete
MQVVVGIDVGHSNMGIAVCGATRSISDFEVLFFEKYNLHFYEGALYERVNAFCDAVILPLLNCHEDSKVVIEMQPPTGLTTVENVILTRLRDHDVLRVHPKSFHIRYKLTHLDYDGRKERVSEMAEQLITNCILAYKFGNMLRKHDVADAILFCHYVLQQQLEQKYTPRLLQDFEAEIEQFRFKSP